MNFPDSLRRAGLLRSETEKTLHGCALVVYLSPLWDAHHPYCRPRGAYVVGIVTHRGYGGNRHSGLPLQVHSLVPGNGEVATLIRVQANTADLLRGR